MTFASLHKLVTYAFAALGLSSLFLGSELPLPSVLAIVVLFLASLVAEGERIDSPAWQRFTTTFLLGAILLSVVRAFLGEALLPLGLEFTAMLQISRLANRRTAQEHQQIALLGFLHLCAATVLSTELEYGLVFFGFVIVAPWMLALTHLRQQIEAHYRGGESLVRHSAEVRRVLASSRVVGWPFLLGTAALAIPLFMFTSLLFILFPRVGLGMLSFDRQSGDHLAGFGSEVELGQVGTVRDDATVVLRIEPDRVPQDPPRRVWLRLRGTSFDHYDGRRWSRSSAAGMGLGRIDGVYAISRQPRAEDSRWRIVLEHLSETVVFLPLGTIAIEVDPRVTNGRELGRSMRLSRGLELRYEDDDSLGFSYFAYLGNPDEGFGSLSPDDLAGYLDVPSGHELLAQRAREWTNAQASDDAKARALVQHFASFAYTTRMRDSGTLPPLVAFVERWRAGHCEYFSSAMALMLRTLGIPARNATGFLGGRWNAYGRYYAIRAGDAHSWVEAWIDGKWRTFDPTPPARNAEGFGEGLKEDIAAWIDALERRWESDVVSYDLRAQRDGARAVWRWWRGTRDSNAPAERRAANGKNALGWVLAILGAIAAGALVRGYRVRARGKGMAHAPTARSGIALLRALDRYLDGRGVPRPSARTPLEHAAHLEEQGFTDAPLVQEATKLYLDARWGDIPPQPQHIERIRQRLEN